jgi:hypothetical protein
MTKAKPVLTREAQADLRRRNVTRKVYLFGPYSLGKAQQHVWNHRGKTLVILKAPDRRIAVCGPHMALELRAKGFTPIDVKE